MSSATTNKGEITRTAIITAAYDLFITLGYSATSMRKIAQSAGIALGGIYNHFTSKEEIFKAVFIENHPYLEMIPAIEAAQGATIEEYVRDVAQKMMTAMQHKPDFLNLMFIEIVEFKSIHMHEVFSETLPRGIRIVEKISSKRGNLRPIPAPMLIRTFIGLFFSYYLAELIFGNVAPPDFKQNAIDYYVDIYLHGIINS